MEAISVFSSTVFKPLFSPQATLEAERFQLTIGFQEGSNFQTVPESLGFRSF